MALPGTPEAMSKWLTEHRRPHVAGERVVKFSQFSHGPLWELVIQNGLVFARWPGDPVWKWVPADAEYVGRRWFCCPERGWIDATPTRMASLFYDLATRILPYWELHVHPNFDRFTRKGWSHEGVTEEGDLGNHVYTLVLEVAQLQRQRLGYRRLYQIDQFNLESKGDVLEGIMALQAMGMNWDPTGVVSEVCIMVKNFWNTTQLNNQWNMDALANTMYTHMDLDSIKDEFAYQTHTAKVAAKMNIALSIGRAVGFRAATRVYSFLA